jgi:hypothetical protein
MEANDLEAVLYVSSAAPAVFHASWRGARLLRIGTGGGR